MCWLLQLCHTSDVQSFLIGLATFIFMMGILVVCGLAAYFEAKSKSPPVSGEDIRRIIEDAKSRAYDRGRIGE